MSDNLTKGAPFLTTQSLSDALGDPVDYFLNSARRGYVRYADGEVRSESDASFAAYLKQYAEAGAIVPRPMTRPATPDEEESRMSTKTLYAINWNNATLNAAEADKALIVLAKAYLTGLHVDRPLPEEVASARMVVGEMIDHYLLRAGVYRPAWGEQLDAVATKLDQPDEPLNAGDLAALEKLARDYDQEAARWFRKLMGV